MKISLALVATLSVTAASHVAAEPSVEHAAACVAALQQQATGLANQYRTGQVEVEDELLTMVEQGFAFIGVAYKQGLRSEAADRLLKQAHEAQEKLPAAELTARQTACSAEGAQILANANALERAFVLGAARRRVDKLKRAS